MTYKLVFKRISNNLFKVISDNQFIEIPGYYSDIHKNDLWYDHEIQKFKQVFNVPVMVI